MIITILGQVHRLKKSYRTKLLQVVIEQNISIQKETNGKTVGFVEKTELDKTCLCNVSKSL